MVAVAPQAMEVLETAGLIDPDGAETPLGFGSAPSIGAGSAHERRELPWPCPAQGMVIAPCECHWLH